MLPHLDIVRLDPVEQIGQVVAAIGQPEKLVDGAQDRGECWT